MVQCIKTGRDRAAPPLHASIRPAAMRSAQPRKHNQHPDQVNVAATVYPSFPPFGINGGYYYARLGFRF
jgi:hypothetical protein